MKGDPWGYKNHLSILVSAVVSSIGFVVLDVVGILIINIIAVVVKVVHVQRFRHCKHLENILEKNRHIKRIKINLEAWT